LEIHVVDPLSDSRWDELVRRHPSASIFHERGWLEALSRTYHYKPLVLTSTPPGEQLENGVVMCRVSSWITGTRLVSLPFSDHCDPLVSKAGELHALLNWLQTECDRQHCGYVEVRPLLAANRSDVSLRPSCSYWFHELDLTPSLDEVFRRLHGNSFRRKIRRAEREHLSYEVGHSAQLLDEFYRLLLITRKRHRLLPQPRAWFGNLLQSMGDKLQIRIARKDDRPIAAILALRHRPSVVYKYGCSDETFHNLGGIALLFWKLLEESKAAGAERVDLGRTDLSNEGLITFKDRLGATRKPLTYYRYAKAPGRAAAIENSRAVRQLLSLLPQAVSSRAGRVLYRHMG
jgi:CelD/BcsL family acetyltransferase involved in cellulose biosynthesis